MSAEAWLSVIGEPPPGVVHLFCFPHAGGTAAAFHPFRRLLAPGIDVAGVELPGRGSRFREPLPVSLAQIAAGTAEAILQRARGTFLLYGHSIGALMAFETCRELLRRGRPPAALLVSGRAAPDQPIRGEGVSTRSDAELAALLARYAGTPPAILQNEELLRLYLPVLRHDFALAENYRYQPAPPLPLPLWLYAGSDDALAGPQDLLSWQAMGSAGHSLSTLPGGHFFPYEGAADFCRGLALRIRELAAPPVAV